ncbi:MAG: nucleotidyl transferase AbiEii/AbiGii toxin family protein [Candidatus Thermoplasmatota archaeon]|nr:nucleotidyl transferase AbiEii/AbiGii toxin family protein [Candidatus Thermoplasmatota archaeon]
MTVPLYDSQETGTALDALGALSRSLPEPFLLIGGWAVYLTVNESFSQIHGTPYLGSRDIDVCFHVDPEQAVDALRTSTFAQALKVVKEAGYRPHGSYRFCKMIRRVDGTVLTEETAKGFPLHEIVYLYVDMMVDNVHPRHKHVFRCDPLDEPIAAQMFIDGDFVKQPLGDFDIHIPNPASLLATKLRSIPQRQQDDKLWKDACDIYSIIWHSSEDYSSIIRKVRKEYPGDCTKARIAMTDEVAGRAAYHIGIERDEFTSIIDLLEG